jgi:hypothetical protein
MNSGSPQPPFPDIEGSEYYRQGDTAQRARTVRRHREGLERCFATVAGSSAGQNCRDRAILVVAHGCTPDFVEEALCGSRFPHDLHTAANGPAVPHVSLTTFRRDTPDHQWDLGSFAVPTFTTDNANGGDGEAADSPIVASCPTRSETHCNALNCPKL